MRVRGRYGGQPVDEVYNYGVFDYGAPNFVYRFVKGETDYMAAATPTDYFVYQYVARGSRVEQQDLRLTAAQADSLYRLLLHDIQPEFREYRYKYFSNNCATRLRDNVERVTGRPLGVQTANPEVQPGAQSLRDVLRRYDDGYPWYRLGIDIALGQAIDAPATVRQTMFVPGIMRDVAARDAALVAPAEVLYEGAGDVRLAPTPWWRSPLFVFGAVLVAVAAVLRFCRRPRWIYSLWFAATGLAGCLVWFLIFVSVHEATSPNLLGWWLTPLAFVPSVSVWLPRARRFNRVLLTAYGVITAAVLAATLWLCLNPALMLMMATTILLCFWRRG